MNRTSLLGSLVLGLAVCTHGFSFELLDRMLGSSGCGCETSCCSDLVLQVALPRPRLLQQRMQQGLRLWRRCSELCSS